MTRRFQISFEQDCRVHWIFTDSEEAAELTTGALQLTTAKHVEVLDLANPAHPVTPSWAPVSALAAAKGVNP